MRPNDRSTVLVTGGTGALGTAVCRRLLSEGCSVHVTWVKEAERDQFPLVDHCTLHQVELTEESAVIDLYRRVGALWASIHVAGGFAMGPIESMSLADFDQMFQRNAVSAFLCCREAVRAMRQEGGGGRLVNVGARPAVEPVGGMLAYSSSKAAVASMTQCLAKELLDESILVNAVLPSIMDTPANREGMPDADFSIWPTVDEVAETIAWLASPENTLTTGALVPVYGRS
ncbi:MAG: SDR family NAD(P)-dependent oxidoreductase [Planctomycetota bacterium]|nr:SDR family NAD(P)-dependent oxidoreductase [Planctomycetota bacterium]